VTPGAWIIKSVWEHASVGLDEDSVVEASDTAPLRSALDRLRGRVGGEGFVERFIDGREFNIALLGRGPDREPEVLPAAEIEFRGYGPERPKVVGFSAKWDEASFAYQHTFRRYEFGAEDAGLLARLADLSRRCWSEFDLRGYARVDFRVDEAGEAWILEVNANPCISPDAGFMAAAERAGLSGEDVVRRLVEGLAGAAERAE
jgi:D-alanine-D-alanine ligase